MRRATSRRSAARSSAARGILVTVLLRTTRPVPGRRSRSDREVLPGRPRPLPDPPTAGDRCAGRTHRRPRRGTHDHVHRLVHPSSRRAAPVLVAALLGAAAFALSLTAGEVSTSTASARSPGDQLAGDLAYVGLVLSRRPARRLARPPRAGRGSGPARPLPRSVSPSASVVTFVVFWSGWPQVLGAVALALALEHRRRVGGFTALSGTAAAVGTLGLATARPSSASSADSARRTPPCTRTRSVPPWPAGS